jgi:hypothetical protein
MRAERVAWVVVLGVGAALVGGRVGWNVARGTVGLGVLFELALAVLLAWVALEVREDRPFSGGDPNRPRPWWAGTPGRKGATGPHRGRLVRRAGLAAVVLAVALVPVNLVDDLVGPVMDAHWPLFRAQAVEVRVPAGSRLQVMVEPNPTFSRSSEPTVVPMTCETKDAAGLVHVLPGSEVVGRVPDPDPEPFGPEIVATTAPFRVHCDWGGDLLSSPVLDRVGPGWYLPLLGVLRLTWLLAVTAGVLLVVRRRRRRPVRD